MSDAQSLVTIEVSPIPILPLESMRTASVPCVAMAAVSAAGKKMPVLVSPVGTMAGEDAVPAPLVIRVVATSVGIVPVVIVAAVDVVVPKVPVGIVPVVIVAAVDVVVPKVPVGIVPVVIVAAVDVVVPKVPVGIVPVVIVAAVEVVVPAVKFWIVPVVIVALVLTVRLPVAVP